MRRRSRCATLAEKYDFLGPRLGHAEQAGHVHLYVKKAVAATALSVPGLPGVACTAGRRHTRVVFVALHLVAGHAETDQREKHLRRAMQLAGAPSDTVVLFGDLNFRDAGLAVFTGPSGADRAGGLFGARFRDRV